jgi:type II secretory pathway pseudopilin PulG
MPIKIKRFHRVQKSGFSLMELVVAFAIFSVIFLSIFSLVANIQVQQKKIQIANRFYDESRLVMDRVAQKIRNNTIDYDRYYAEDNSGASYEDAFLKDIGGRKRNLGGVIAGSDPREQISDPGTEAFSTSPSPPTELYLINAERTVRTAIRFSDLDNDGFGEIEIQTLLGVDSDNDGMVDQWEVSTWDPDTEECTISSSLVEGDFSEVLFCNQAHDWTSIVPSTVQVTAFSFRLGPNKDPYLAFADKNVQIQPFVQISFATTMADNVRFGFAGDEKPSIQFQTGVSSRVFGDTRE